MKRNKWLHLSSGFSGISLGWDLLRKSIDQKNVLSGQQIELVGWWFVKYFFAPNYPIFRKKFGREAVEGHGERPLERQLQSVMLFKQTQEVCIRICIPIC